MDFDKERYLLGLLLSHPEGVPGNGQKRVLYDGSVLERIRDALYVDGRLLRVTRRVHSSFTFHDAAIPVYGKITPYELLLNLSSGISLRDLSDFVGDFNQVEGTVQNSVPDWQTPTHLPAVITVVRHSDDLGTLISLHPEVLMN